MKTINKLKNLSGKIVLLRVDYNVPLKKGEILDDEKIVKSLPTIRTLQAKKAKIIIVTHLGRPEGKIVSDLKIDPVAVHLGELLKQKIVKLDSKNWDKKSGDKMRLEMLTTIDAMRPGEVAMLENIRFSKDEEENKGTLAQELANLADIFVLDGFAVAHRGDASVVGVAKYLPSYAGLLMESEVKALTKVLKSPKKPFVAIIGGVKAETKIPVIKNLLKKSNYILIGGGIVNTYLYSKGFKIGSSVVDKKYAKEILEYCKSKKVIKPLDVVVGDIKGKKYWVKDLDKNFKITDKNLAIYDIGPKTIQEYAKYIKKAKTIVWNGAMGYFEQHPYENATYSIARLVATRSKGSAFGVVGGGETLLSLEAVKMSEYVDHISTGGGAMLEFLSGKKLPGVKIL
ncbi:MAG: phosphoglycerate kinase [Patescibacteria group bacterium]|nr:phosphoglycerate kinase [Patescibacteria group bacterium]